MSVNLQFAKLEYTYIRNVTVVPWYHTYIHIYIYTYIHIPYEQGGSLRSLPACTCVCLHVLLNLVWNSLCIPCMDSSPTMSRWSIIQSKTLYHVVVGSLFDCNFRGYRSAWQLRAPFTWFLEHSIEHAHL